MIKLVKLLFWLVGLAVILVPATIITIVSIDLNEHKDWLTAEFREKTGRSLSLDGDINITLYPWLGLEANGLSLGNAQGFGDAPFLHVDYIKLRVKSIPLLREEYEVDTVHIRGAVINLARNEQGVSNWDGLISGDEPEHDAPALPLASIILGGVAVENARVTWDDQQAAVRHDVSDLNISTAELEYGKPINFNLSFHGKSNKPAVDSTVRLTGIITYDTDARQYAVSPLDINALIKGKNIPGGETTATLSAGVNVNLDDETASISDGKIDALGMTIEGNISASRIESPKPSINATVNVQGSDLGLLFKVAEIEPLASQLARLGDRDFQVSAAVDANLERGDIDLSELSANLLGAAVTGEVKARNIHSDTPGYQGELNARGPDLPTLLKVVGQLQGGKNPTLTDYGKKLANTPAKAFRLAANFDADLKSGDVSVPVLSINALGISATGALDAKNMQTQKGTVSGNLNVKGAEISGLLTAFDQADLAQVLRSVELDTRIQGTRAGIALAPLALEAVIAGKDIPGSPVKVVLDADAKINLDEETLTLHRFSLDGLGLKSAGNLRVDKVLSAPAFSGQVDVQPFDPRKLAGQLKQKLPVATDWWALTRVALSSRFNGLASELNLSKPAFQLDETRLTGELKIADMDEKPALQFNLNVDEINLDEETLTLHKFSLDSLGLKSAGNLRVDKVLSAPAFSGQVDIQPFNPRKLAGQFKQKLPVTTDRQALTRVALSGQFNGSASELNLSKLAFQLDETRLTGELKIADMDENPALQFDLNVDEINLDRYMSPAPAQRNKSTAKRKTQRAGEIEKAANSQTRATGIFVIPVDTVQKLNMAGDFDVNKLIVSNATLERVKLRMDAKDGVVKMAPVSADLYQGRFSGDIELDVNPASPRLALNSRLQGIQAEPLLEDVTGKAKFRGKGDFSATLSATGENSDLMKQNLDGQISLNLSDGAIIGFNLEKTLHTWKQSKQDELYDIEETEVTDFSVLTGNLVANAGVVRMDDLNAEAPTFRLTGKGILADLHTDIIDYRASATVTGASKEAGGKGLAELIGFDLPVNIKGPLDNPKVELAWGVILGSLRPDKIVDEIFHVIDLSIPHADKSAD